MFDVTVDGHRLEVERPTWLFARTCRLINRAGLIVYRSPMLRPVSPLYTPVREFLSRHDGEIHRRGMVLDAGMMLGRGELSVYFTRAIPHLSDDDITAIEWPANATELEGV